MSNNSITEQSGFAHLTDLPCYVLQCGQATAVISSYGAHLLSYKPEAEVELIYLSPEAVWQNNTPIRGGVPVCWPWFGPAAAEFNPKAQKLPNHGVVRTEFWQVIQQSVTETEVRIEFRIATKELPYTNAPSYLSLTLQLTEAALILTLNSDQGLQQAALHSYFTVDSVHQVSVSTLAGAYLDKVKAGERFDQQHPELKFTAEVDRVYLDTADELTLEQAKNAVQIAQQGHDASVLWNPWIEKAAALKDLPDDGYLDFVCVETARLSLTTSAPLHLVQQIRYLGQLE
ncbi:D-hexose-6-phosphate mutarotase [Rheinheimera tangshanensis]|jgi:glucose-6-phosphate 1-epimerase|uniref:Putative glucose-6-phosphate 1-epimerase n=1 Tax=Rheinheimera tangshanensis TaxID=400153 RepID=A0A5C8LRG4_9GAMM|nr:D-hexose-6-phosphate mutarotase [Rheinheimera tangshanensis]TXK79961.1 D-hexose-6-phosphate mutarotase [Rheinheimera tangshanensis]GGM64442.1 D-hexose-6-phosphate mutarotase [Rheinheimera tangshanensis]